MSGGTGTGYANDENSANKKAAFGLEKVLKAKASYNPVLKIIAYERKNDGENFFSKRMFNYLCDKFGKDNERLKQLNLQTKYLGAFSRVQGFFMEIFGGYKQI